MTSYERLEFIGDAILDFRESDEPGDGVPRDLRLPFTLY